METWKYRVEPYRWNGDGSWSPTKDAAANGWFLIGEKGEDGRVFGLFASCADARDAAHKLASGRMGEQYVGSLESTVATHYQKMLADAPAPMASNHDKEIER